MFDVKPVKKSGGLDFEKISRVKAEINLKREPATPQSTRPTLIEYQVAHPQAPVIRKEVRPSVDSKHSLIQEFEKTLVEPLDPTVELARMGARIHPFIKQKSSPRFIVRKEKKEPIAETVLASVYTPASREIDFWLAHPGLASAKPGETRRIRPRGKFLVYSGGFVLAGLFLWLIVQGGVGARNSIVQNGGNAVANLEEAKQKLEDFKFQDAANSFALAYDDLNKASGTLNELGASFLSIFGGLPGLGKVKAANNLVEAGRNISKAGENLALALGTLYNSNPFSLLNAPVDSVDSPRAGSGSKSLSRLLGEFKTVLADAGRNIRKASGLLADIDNSVIPEDKQPLLLDFKEKVSQFQEYIGGAIDYSDFLLKFVGSSGKKTYLVLLQNNSELRPTGGFPGTYALVTFEDGYLKKIFVDDIYQIDANLRENIIPPLQIQHITPTWGMRDANWFADFPTSARKVEEFYQKDGGGKVDGVLAITPDVIAEMLKITGPIDMPEYGMKLDAGNFLAEIQNEVEYEADRMQPKKILADLQPRFFEKLGGQDKNNWLEVFKIILKAFEEKHILAYFNGSDLQKVAVSNGFGGEIKQTAGDFLEIVFANVKGSKTDFVTDNSFNLETSLAGDGDVDPVKSSEAGAAGRQFDGVEHTLTISRLHNGGDSQYGFYNRDNSAYVKVFIPEGSVLESIVGQSITDFRPLISYEGFERDPDLERIEEGVSHPVAGVDVSEESGKTVFGFWLIVRPKEAKSVVLKYRTPVAGTAGGSYNLYWQKQSGIGGDHINFSFKLPDNSSVINQSPDLQQLGNNLILNSDLSIDREIKIQFK